MQDGVKLDPAHQTVIHTENNMYQVSHKHSCISWRRARSRPEHVEIDRYKYTKNKIVHQVVIFTRFYRDARPTKRKTVNVHIERSCYYYCCNAVAFKVELFMLLTETQLNRCLDFTVRSVVTSSKAFFQLRKETTIRRQQLFVLPGGVIPEGESGMSKVFSCYRI
jgi:hypothetical protein